MINQSKTNQQIQNMSDIYDPLSRSIDMLKRNSNPNASIQMALINLESMQRTRQLKEDSFSRQDDILNIYKSQNAKLHSKLKDTKESYETVKKEKENIKVYSDERIRNVRSILFDEIDNLKKKEAEKRNILLEYITNHNAKINILKTKNANLEENKREMEQQISQLKRKSETTETTEKKRKRFLSA